MTLKFFLKKHKSGNLSLVARFYDGSKSKDKPAGFTTTEPDYFKKNKRLKNNADANTLITAWQNKFNEYISHCEESQKTPVLNTAISYVCGDLKITGFTLSDVIDQFIEIKRITHKTETLDKYSWLKVTLNDYAQYIEDNPGLKLSSTVLDKMTKGFYEDFSSYCIREKKNCNLTVKRRLGMLTTLVRFAKDREMVADVKKQIMPILKTPDSNRFPLEEEELAVLKDYKTVLPLDRVKMDAFLFSCETGIRFSDVIKISSINIKTAFGNSVLECHMTKGGTKKLAIPLSDYALKIIKKYKVDDVNTPFFALPSSELVNRRLKEIFKACKLNRVCEINVRRGRDSIITTPCLHEIAHFHMARHTFGTLLIERGVPLVQVKEMMGHSDVQTTMKYVRINKSATIDAVRQALNSVNNIAV